LAHDRDLVSHDRVAVVRVAAMNPTPYQSARLPGDYAKLIDALPLKMALPYVLAGQLRL